MASIKKINQKNSIFLYNVQEFKSLYPTKYKEIGQQSKKMPTLILLVSQGIQIAEAIDLYRILKKRGVVGSIESLAIVLEIFSSVKICAKITTRTGKFFDKIRSIDFFIKEYAQLNFFYDNGNDHISDSKDVQEVNSLSFYLESYAYTNIFFAFFEKKCAKINFEIYLRGNHAYAMINGMYMLVDKQILQIQVKQNHEASDTKSQCMLYGMVCNIAQFGWKGNVFISQKGQRSIAMQRNKNLVFGNMAQVFSSPSLEVCTNEVTCKHGSAIGKIDADNLFYLQSRGISKEEIKRLLIEGFFGFLFKSLDNQNLKEDLLKRVRIKMKQVEFYG